MPATRSSALEPAFWILSVYLPPVFLSAVLATFLHRVVDLLAVLGDRPFRLRLEVVQPVGQSHGSLSRSVRA
jgi:hypothetical protein